MLSTKLSHVTSPHALKGQKLLAQGKAFKYQAIYKAFALSGRLADYFYTQGVALG